MGGIFWSFVSSIAIPFFPCDIILDLATFSARIFHFFFFIFHYDSSLRSRFPFSFCHSVLHLDMWHVHQFARVPVINERAHAKTGPSKPAWVCPRPVDPRSDMPVQHHHLSLYPCFMTLTTSISHLPHVLSNCIDFLTPSENSNCLVI